MTARRNGRGASAFRRRFPNQITQVVFIKAVVIDAADKSQTDFATLRDRPAWPRLNQRAVVVGFMVIAVEQRSHRASAKRC